MGTVGVKVKSKREIKSRLLVQGVGASSEGQNWLSRQEALECPPALPGWEGEEIHHPCGSGNGAYVDKTKGQRIGNATPKHHLEI